MPSLTLLLLFQHILQTFPVQLRGGNARRKRSDVIGCHWLFSRWGWGDLHHGHEEKDRNPKGIQLPDLYKFFRVASSTCSMSPWEIVIEGNSKGHVQKRARTTICKASPSGDGGLSRDSRTVKKDNGPALS